MKKMFFVVLCLANLSYSNNISNTNDYQAIIFAANSSIENYTSENNEVQIEIVRYKNNNDKLKQYGYLRSLVLCDVLACKTYKYKPNEVQVFSVGMLYARFVAATTHGKLIGHICDKQYSICSSNVELDIRAMGKRDFETNFIMHNEKTIKIEKVSHSYL